MVRSLSAIYLVTAISSLGIGLGGCNEADAEEKITPIKPIPVEVEVVRVEDVQEYRELSGDVHPLEILPLSFKVGGRISRIFFDEGDQVKKGALVALLDPRDYRLTRDLAASQVNALEPHLKRAEKLRDQEALSEAQFDDIKSRMNAAKIQKSQADAQLSYARLKAPISGVVVKRMVAVGDVVGPSRPVAVLATLKRVEVKLPVTQRDLPLFEVGIELSLTAPGVSRSFTGKVQRVGFTADEKTRTFPVVLEVDNPNLELRAGMVVETRVPVKRHRGVFVRLDAVTRDVSGSPRLLVVDKSEKSAEGRNVKVGALVGDRVQVLEGLEIGDKVIVRGMVQAGNPVVVVDSKTTGAAEHPR